MDLVKAVFLAVVVIALFFAVTTIIAAVFPALIFGGLVIVIWFILKALKEANTPPDG